MLYLHFSTILHDSCSILHVVYDACLVTRTAFGTLRGYESHGRRDSRIREDEREQQREAARYSTIKHAVARAQHPAFASRRRPRQGLIESIIFIPKASACYLVTPSLFIKPSGSFTNQAIAQQRQRSSSVHTEAVNASLCERSFDQTFCLSSAST